MATKLNIERQPDWPVEMFIPMLHGAARVRDQQNKSHVRPNSSLCFQTLCTDDIDAVCLGVCLRGGPTDIFFEFSKKEEQERFEEFICAHVDVSLPLKWFEPYDIAQEAAEILACITSDPDGDHNFKPNDMRYALSMCANTRIAQAASEQITVRADLVLASDELVMLLKLQPNVEEAQSQIFKLIKKLDRIGDETVTYHMSLDTVSA